MARLSKTISLMSSYAPDVQLKRSDVDYDSLEATLQQKNNAKTAAPEFLKVKLKKSEPKQSTDHSESVTSTPTQEKIVSNHKGKYQTGGNEIQSNNY